MGIDTRASSFSSPHTQDPSGKIVYNFQNPSFGEFKVSIRDHEHAKHYTIGSSAFILLYFILFYFILFYFILLYFWSAIKIFCTYLSVWFCFTATSPSNTAFSATLKGKKTSATLVATDPGPCDAESVSAWNQTLV